jgi:hypothetical protein
MSAIVTDQFRIFNASNFIESVLNSSNSYYVFVGLSNPSTSGFGRTPTWDTNTPNPVDNIDYLNHNKSTVLFGKKITSANIRRVIKRIDWISGTRYEMYRPDYGENNKSPITDSMRLYDTNYYVINSDYRVYICIDNGSNVNNPTGNSSENEPTFTDLETVKFNDGYTWKYLFTISPSDIIKFDSTEYIALPNDWNTSTDPQILAVRENGNSNLNDNQIKKVYINKVGAGYINGIISCNIVGDGSGATASVEINSGSISDVTVTSGGKNYTYALVDLKTVSGAGVTSFAELIPIIPPSKGHGYDLYKELGADKILIYARFDDSTKDFPVDTKFSQVGILKNPTIYDSTGVSTSIYNQNEFSSVYSMRFDSDPIGTVNVGDIIKQSVSGGIAYGYVVSYDSETKVLKYTRDRSLYFNNAGNSGIGTNHTDFIGISSYYSSTDGTLFDFESSANLVTTNTFSGTIGSFTGITTTIGNKIINLGVEFTDGLSKPEINNMSGDVIYIDNRPTVTRSSRQKEDIKIILEF